jgi:hypothetical protein
MLLKGFDILREAGSKPLVKSFERIEPTPQGKIEIYFTLAACESSEKGWLCEPLSLEKAR